MCRYFCTGFIDFLLEGKSLLEDKNLYSPNEYKKNDRMILNISNYENLLQCLR